MEDEFPNGHELRESFREQDEVLWSLRCKERERFVDITGTPLGRFFSQRHAGRQFHAAVPICRNCGEQSALRIANEQTADDICPSCGAATRAVALKMAWSDTAGATVRKSDGYKRINHFNERLMQLQGKEAFRVNETIMAVVRADVLRYGRDGPTPKRIRQVLKRCGFPQLYEHSVQISLALGGTAPYAFTAEQEERLRVMFAQVQGPYERCPSELKMDPLTKRVKKNFIRYSYFLFKACELLQIDHALSSLSLLKSTTKRLQHDRIWEYICGQLGWEFIPSVPFEIE